mmetsp:Transcript_17796/g.58223  ORF Transcript_17796/g.58223 Transcript_17796/m.58223 type:complete len:225 (-) Transcript_17796:1082-1756(-)
MSTQQLSSVRRVASTRALRRSTRAAGSAKAVAATSSISRDQGLWLKDATPPPHLDGTLAGDFGFDPLGLGTNPDRLKWYAEAELMNARWAMYATAGILGQEFLGVGGKWYETGAGDFDIPVAPLLALQFPIMGFLETKRLQGYNATGESGFINSFPFDPLGMSDDSMKLKEVKNGRLAMISFVGFAVQGLVVREGPIECLKMHIADPFNANIFGSIAKLPETLA